MTIRRSVICALAALVAGASTLAYTPAQAAPQALSPWDAQLYAAAFDAVKRGDVNAVESNLAQVKDRCLVGMVEFDKLFKVKGYKASYDELTQWLSQYGDLPMAPKVMALAKKRKPDGAADPTSSAAAPDTPHSWASMESVPLSPTADIDPLDPKAPRLAFNAGDLHTALMLADASGDRWTGGLAAYRMKNYDEAFRRFQLIALDVSEAPMDRSRAGYWGARAAIAKGAPDQAPELLRIAAQFPRTFYGQIAEHQLGLQPGSLDGGGVPYNSLPSSPIVRASLTSSIDLDSPEMRHFIDGEPRAKRALALAEIGQRVDAGIEIRAGLGMARDEQARAQWTALALGVNGMFPAYSAEADARDYPMPDLQPQGGFTIDRALVYALIRQESAFKPRAHSYAGAYGLMQVMPSNAAWLERDPSFRGNPERLFDPGTNLRVGQDYILYLMSQPDISGDILKTVAAYDGGPGPVYESIKQVGYSADDLMTIESIPVPETRDYVERVMANYWIYKRMLGEKTRSLDAVADGDRVVQVALDRAPRSSAPPVTVQPVLVSAPPVSLPANATAIPVSENVPVPDTDNDPQP